MKADTKHTFGDYDGSSPRYYGDPDTDHLRHHQQTRQIADDLIKRMNNITGIPESFLGMPVIIGTPEGLGKTRFADKWFTKTEGGHFEHLDAHSLLFPDGRVYDVGLGKFRVMKAEWEAVLMCSIEANRKKFQQWLDGRVNELFGLNSFIHHMTQLEKIQSLKDAGFIFSPLPSENPLDKHRTKEL